LHLIKKNVTQRTAGPPKLRIRSIATFATIVNPALGVANNGKKVSPWWNQEVKGAIRAKKAAYKAWLHNKDDSSLHSWYAEARKSAAFMVKESKLQAWQNFDINWIPITDKPTKCSGEPSAVSGRQKI